MNCSKCGYEIRENQKFCINCGTKICNKSGNKIKKCAIQYMLIILLTLSAIAVVIFEGLKIYHTVYKINICNTFEYNPDNNSDDKYIYDHFLYSIDCQVYPQLKEFYFDEVESQLSGMYYHFDEFYNRPNVFTFWKQYHSASNAYEAVILELICINLMHSENNYYFNDIPNMPRKMQLKLIDKIKKMSKTYEKEEMFADIQNTTRYTNNLVAMLSYMNHAASYNALERHIIDLYKKHLPKDKAEYLIELLKRS